MKIHLSDICSCILFIKCKKFISLRLPTSLVQCHHNGIFKFRRKNVQSNSCERSTGAMFVCIYTQMIRDLAKTCPACVWDRQFPENLFFFFFF